MERRSTSLIAATLMLLSTNLLGEEIRFRLAQKQLIVLPVVVNGEGPYDFLLDTGSTTSVVDQSLAKELGLEPLQETVLRTASGTERVPIARLHTVELGSRSTQTVLVLCSKMEGIPSLDRRIRGILGFNALSRFRYTIDYKERVLRFEDRGAVEGVRVPFNSDGRSIVLTTDGWRWLLDTGATSVFLLRTDGLDLTMNARAVRRVSTASGHRATRSGSLRRLDIGDASFERVPVTLLPQTGLESRADGLVPGTLFDAIHIDHDDGFVVLNPKPVDPTRLSSLPQHTREALGRECGTFTGRPRCGR